MRNMLWQIIWTVLMDEIGSIDKKMSNDLEVVR